MADTVEDRKKNIETMYPRLERTEEFNGIHFCNGAVAQFVCSGSGGGTKRTGILGRYIIGGRGALALGQGATVKREEVCVYMYFLTCLFSGVEGVGVYASLRAADTYQHK